MKSVALSGASGFVGTALLTALQQRGVNLQVLTRRPLAADVQQISGDLTRPESLEPLVTGVDTLFHLAGYAHATSRPCADELEKHRRINLHGSLNLFAAARTAGVRRFIFVSSVKAGGEHPHECLDELHAVPPQDPYGQIKQETEARLHESAAASATELVVIRPALVYGPGVKGNLAALLRAIDRGRMPRIAQTDNVRSMVGRDDLVRALLLAATAPVGGRTFIITDTQAYSTARICTAMAAALGRRLPGLPLSPRTLRCLGRLGDTGERLLRRPLPFNSSLAARLLDSACYHSLHAGPVLGFEPQDCLEDVLPAMVAAYRS